MTEHSPAQSQEQPSTGGPRLRFRTPYRRVEQAPTAQAAYDIAMTADDSWEHSRMMLALARRPDLTARVLTKIGNNHAIRNNDQWFTSLCVANPRLASTKAAQPFFNRTVVEVLLAGNVPVDGLEDRLISEVATMHIGDPKSFEFVRLLRAKVPAEQIRQAVNTMLADPQTAMTVAASPLLDADGWVRLMAMVPTTKKAVKEKRNDLYLQRVLEVLMHRPDLTQERSETLLAAFGTGREAEWRISALLRNPACPKSVFLRVAMSKSKALADAALTSRDCPDEARMGAIMAGRPYAAIRIHSPLPVEVAHKALDDAHLVRSSKGRPARNEWDNDDQDANENKIVDQVTRYTDDPHAMQRCLDHVLARAGMPRDEAIGTFVTNLLSRHSTHYISNKHVEPYDHAMDFLAGHPDGDVRAHVVAEIHPEEFDAVKADPSEAVRIALLTRLVRERSTDLGWAIADPSPRVRMALAADENADPGAWLQLAHDPDEKIAAVVGERILTMLAEGTALPETV